MSLQNYQYDIIMREYSKTQSRNRRLLEERTQEIYEKIPRIKEKYHCKGSQFLLFLKL